MKLRAFDGPERKENELLLRLDQERNIVALCVVGRDGIVQATVATLLVNDQGNMVIYRCSGVEHDLIETDSFGRIIDRSS